jgi:hypothetical protein
MLYILFMKPYDTPFKNNLEVFNEGLIYLIVTCFIPFLDSFTLERDTRDHIGLIILAFVFLYMGFNILLMIVSMIALKIK